jgi:hypothetical protein
MEVNIKMTTGDQIAIAKEVAKELRYTTLNFYTKTPTLSTELL